MFKNIHIGSLILAKWKENNISMERTINFLQMDEIEIEKIFLQKSLDSELLLRWSKLLEYDFFRLYSQHLILYSPPNKNSLGEKKKKLALPQFRKNIYSKELIDFILELIEKGEKTHQQIVDEYRIPKTTLYKWMVKYNPNERNKNE